MNDDCGESDSQRAPVSIDMSDLEFAQHDAVLCHLRNNRIYFEQLGNSITVPGKHADDVLTLIDANRTRSMLDIYAIATDPTFLSDARSRFRRWLASRARTRRRRR